VAPGDKIGANRMNENREYIKAGPGKLPPTAVARFRFASLKFCSISFRKTSGVPQPVVVCNKFAPMLDNRRRRERIKAAILWKLYLLVFVP